MFYALHCTIVLPLLFCSIIVLLVCMLRVTITWVRVPRRMVRSREIQGISSGCRMVTLWISRNVCWMLSWWQQQQYVNLLESMPCFTVTVMLLRIHAPCDETEDTIVNVAALRMGEQGLAFGKVLAFPLLLSPPSPLPQFPSPFLSVLQISTEVFRIFPPLPMPQILSDCLREHCELLTSWLWLEPWL